mmetsp:Transcript_6907/g.13674  ORF Transcript_6907/g.13674 Transcript_6907/m.13674 type:complete len:100 (-) Transcript_6907:24-323(-)
MAPPFAFDEVQHGYRRRKMARTLQQQGVDRNEVDVADVETKRQNISTNQIVKGDEGGNLDLDAMSNMDSDQLQELNKAATLLQAMVSAEHKKIMSMRVC